MYTQLSVMRILHFAISISTVFHAGTRAYSAEQNNLDDINEIRRLLTTRIYIDKRPVGSGIILSTTANNYWIATNRHVVQSNKTACIQTYEGIKHGATVFDSINTRNADIVFLRFNSKMKYPVPEGFLATRRYPLIPRKIIATGFPIGMESTDSMYTERRGVTVPLLSTPIQDGLQLTYTSNIEKGMSGGPVFYGDNQLAGINSLHSDPLWDVDYKDANGKTISPLLSEALKRVAIGVPVSVISNGLAGLPSVTASPPLGCK